MPGWIARLDNQAGEMLGLWEVPGNANGRITFAPSKRCTCLTFPTLFFYQ